MQIGKFRCRLVFLAATLMLAMTAASSAYGEEGSSSAESATLPATPQAIMGDSKDGSSQTDSSSESDSIKEETPSDESADNAKNSAKKSNSDGPVKTKPKPDGDERVPIDTAELMVRAEQAERELDAMFPQLSVPESVKRVRNEVEALEPSVEAVVRRAQKELAEHQGWFIIADLRFETHLRLKKLKNRTEPLDRFVARVSSLAETVNVIADEWRSTRKHLMDSPNPAAAKARVERVLRRVRSVEARLSSAQSAVALTTAKVERVRSSLSEVQTLLERRRPSLINNFNHKGTSPFRIKWPSLSELINGLNETRQHALSTSRKFADAFTGQIILQALIFFGLWGFAYREGKAEKQAKKQEGASEDEVELVLRRPFFCALLSALFATVLLYPSLPASVSVVVITASVICAGAILLDEDKAHNRFLVLGALVLMLFLHAEVALAPLSGLRSWLYLGGGVTVFAFALMLTTFKGLGMNAGWGRFLFLVARFWMLASSLGILLWAFSFDFAVSILIDGSARLMVLTIAFRVAYDVIVSFLRSLLDSNLAKKSRLLRIRRELVVDRLAVGLRLALLYIWGKNALYTYTLHGKVSEMLTQLVEVKLEVGSLGVTVGELIALVVGIAVAVYTSRLTRFVLDEEVLPRTHLSIGSRAAVTSGTGYIVLGGGIFMALAAVGFELDKITILVSALGVGIGFGLQNVVQNFAAGLILIFERPINVGDRVEVGGLFGSVSSVGFRASVVKTIQGAEVIVPNSQFVSDQVINWSLSDEYRRIELDVGVKYGTDPEQVLSILKKAAEQHAAVTDEPAPEALFMKFGDSSLDFQLRCWTATGSSWMNIRSDLTIEINRMLKEAEIEIPFPQRDLNLRTLDDSVAQKLKSQQRSPRD